MTHFFYCIEWLFTKGGCWMTGYKYWINSNLDDLYKICDKTFFLAHVCLSLFPSVSPPTHTFTHTHTRKYLFMNKFLLWCGQEERTFKVKRNHQENEEDSGTHNFVGYSSTTIAVISHESLFL